MNSVHTTQMQQWQERIRAGDRSAKEELLRALCQPLERLARKMLRKFPGVGRMVEAEDVLQNALLRLSGSLEQLEPTQSMRQFYGLATTQIRRELLDLARHFYGPHGQGANQESVGGKQHVPNQSLEPTAEDVNQDLEKWTLFHTEVGKLAGDEREVVGLIFYHGWSTAEVADLFQVSERSVRRWWTNALQKLQERLKAAGYCGLGE